MTQENFSASSTVDKILTQLDNLPRKEWGLALQVALTGAYETGHRNGYATAKAVSISDSFTANIPPQEDRALDKQMGEDEKLEEEGWAFFHVMARKLGKLAREIPLVRPENMVVEMTKMNHPSEIATQIKLDFYIERKM